MGIIPYKENCKTILVQHELKIYEGGMEDWYQYDVL